MRKRAALLAVGTLLVVAVTVPSTATAQEISFAPLTLYHHGDDVFNDRLVTGDVNGDGRSDVLVADVAAPRVTVRLAKADGTLEAPVVLALDATLGLRLVDVNRDHDLDLLLSGQDALRVALGGPGESFGAATPVASLIGGVDVVGDFNDDGDPDLATRDNRAVNVVVLLGGPGGSFGSPTPYRVGDPGGSIVDQVSSADVNGDRDPDLIAALHNRVVVLVGGAGGTFSESARFAGDGSPVTTGDFNGDGDPDLATTPATAVVRVRLGLPGSGFGAPTDYPGLFQTNTLLGLDLDQDGDDELVEWAPSGDEISPGALVVRPGDPSGRLGDPEQTTIPQLAGSPHFVDLNRDGDLDLAFTNIMATETRPPRRSRPVRAPPGRPSRAGPAPSWGARASPARSRPGTSTATARPTWCCWPGSSRSQVIRSRARRSASGSTRPPPTARRRRSRSGSPRRGRSTSSARTSWRTTSAATRTRW